MNICAQDLIQADADLLPPVVRDIVRVIGMEAAVVCINVFCGMKLSIPKGEDNNEHGRASFTRLSDALGRTAALALCLEYGGETLSIPRCHRLRCELINRAIRRDFDVGDDINALAKRYDKTSRGIEIILNRAV